MVKDIDSDGDLLWRRLMQRLLRISYAASTVISHDKSPYPLAHKPLLRTTSALHQSCK